MKIGSCIEAGFVVSGSNVAMAPAQIYRNAEHQTMEEQVVLVEDPSLDRYAFLGVLRRITKYEPIVRDRVRTPYVDRPEILDHTVLMPYTSGVVRLYAMLDTKEKALMEVRHAPTPGSRICIVTDGSFLNSYIRVDKHISVGLQKYSNWPIPLDINYIPYHIGVFGATGMGKSRLIRALLGEFKRVGIRAIVFDHTGIDYAAHFEGHIQSTDVSIPPQIIASVIAKKAGLPWQTYGEYLEIAALTYVFGERTRQGTLAEQSHAPRFWDKEEFLKHLRGQMRRLNARDSTVEKAALFIDYFVEEEFFDTLNTRNTLPEHIVERALDEGLLVIDLSADTDLAVKQAIVASVINAAWRRVKSAKTPQQMVFVIDEAQNYAPNEWAISKDAIETTAREGRKWGLSLVLASQRIAGDIDPSIRANLGTIFFSKLSSPTDLREIAGYMDLADISEATLSQLAPREFFVAGLLNPLRKPLLVRVFEVT